jgi:chromosome segregation protein
LLRLRRVDIFGFKSFAERTRILFNGTGIAAVVGPNGCGKSNISDAILWVLGEQSAKTLRSGRMADCIFNGTASRPPSNLAEVTLTLVDPEGETGAVEPEETPTAAEAVEGSESSESAEDAAPDPKKPARRNRLNLRILPGEIVVTRRLYRDGTSEYYLNGEFCRLRDIQELFMGTGLGPESYAIIEQGRVGQILSSRPHDRRALIEEAAGVTKYKTKRRLAEAKLESAQQNLLRVNDILEEVSKQVNSLKRQASRARRYREVKTEATDLRRRLLATQLEELQTAEAALATQLEANAAELATLSTALAEREQEQTAAQTRQYELESALRQAQNRAGQLMLEVERAQTRVADTRRQQGEVEQRFTELATRRKLVAEQTAATTAALEQRRSQCAELEQELTAITSELERLNAETESLRQQTAALETEQQERRQQHADCAHRLAALRAELAQLQRTAETAGDHFQRLNAERELAQQEREHLAAQEGNLHTALAQARAERARAQENVAAAERTLALWQQEYRDEQQRVEEVRKSLAGALAQQEALKELVASRAALAEPVQKLLLGSGGASATVEFRPVGVVADFAEIDPTYAPLLEDYLHEELEYVVVETYDAARTGVSLLRQQMAGRATFLVDSFGRFPPKLAEEAARPNGNGLIGSVADLIRINGPLGSEAKRVLPKLGRTYVVESARRAEELARDYPQYFFLSTDGTCYHGRLVSGGVRNGHGVHSLARELTRATERRAKIEPEATLAESTLSRLETRRRELEAELDRARQALFAQEKNLLQLEQRLAALVAERARWEKQGARAAEEHAAREDEQRAAAERLATLQQELGRHQAEFTALEEALGGKETSLHDSRRQVEKASARLADLRARGAGLDERLRAAHQEQARLEETLARLAAEQEEQNRLELHLHSEQERLAEELVLREQEVQQRQQEKVEQEARCQQGEVELGELRQTLVEREADLHSQRTSLDAVREQRHTMEVERARQQTEWQHAVLAAQGEFGLAAEELCRQVAERVGPEERPQAEARYQELKLKLENIGPVNMMALEELQESEERHAFLTKQKDDILASIEDTLRAIREIDTVSAEKFQRAFEFINQNFTEVFKTLFGGGTATLRLSEPENPNECGIDLICQPPGKRLQNVLLLSGGEKALTALALLIAVFRYQPSPFCILDEVDAPLDDTNVGRFTRLVAEMAPHTQFIIITHNKKTMEVAPVMYGITMQNAVTQVVSVRFEEQQAPATTAA